MPIEQIIGSVHGIVCFLIYYACISLWNPTTKLYRIIHPPTFPDDHKWGVRQALGFGLDSIHDDFKVVATVDSHSRVYSVNRNVWRMLPSNHTDLPYKRNFELCANNFLLSIGLSGMMAFDLNNEVLNCGIKLPVTTFNCTVTDFKNSQAQAYITEFNASIAVIIFKKMGENQSSALINLWALDDEASLRGGGIEASWTLMLNIDVSLQLQIQTVVAYSDIVIY
ncbi:putative F-box protein At3g16210 [Apium graveolens]|uniref:putative F-box protein At3g16210 n=1 Tax=Apium graveolens TaxID=4045 RepID=UPI003D7B3556